ncbi:MAG TPA: hypothetical protein VEC58_07530, partial [Roseiarcus sp.]|nr:hypothetical protein [Roseiarcus sp.]
AAPATVNEDRPIAAFGAAVCSRRRMGFPRVAAEKAKPRKFSPEALNHADAAARDKVIFRKSS